MLTAGDHRRPETPADSVCQVLQTEVIKMDF